MACQNEVFHRDGIVLSDELARPNGLSLRFWQHGRQSFPRLFLSWLANLSGDPRAFGFKLFPEHGWDKVNLVTGDPSWKIIFLTRRNRLAQYSSLKIARETGLWSEKRGAGIKKPNSNAVKFEPNEYRAYVTGVDESDARVRALLADQAFLGLTYEDLGESMRDVFCFLGLEPPDGYVDLGTTRKQNANNLLDRFSNPEEVVRTLSELGETQYLD